MRLSPSIRFREASDARIAGLANVILIKAGPGNPGDRHYYSADLLKDSVRSGFFEGAQCYLDHPTPIEDKQQPERTVTKLAGYFTDCKLTTQDGATAIVGLFHPQLGRNDVLGMLRTATEYAEAFPNRAYVGLSINAAGQTDEKNPVIVNGARYSPVVRFDELISVDIVTRAGAGGRVLSFREAWRAASRTIKPSRCETIEVDCVEDLSI